MKNSPKIEKLLMLRCETLGWLSIAQVLYNNITRTTVEAISIVFGNTQSLHPTSCNEVHTVLSKFEIRIARNSRIIPHEESGVLKVLAFRSDRIW